jgi:putative transposase
MKKRHKAEEIIRILRDVERAKSVTDGVRLHGISEQTYYRWKKKYGGMSVDEGKRLKELERENQRLKKIVAEQTLMIDGLEEINRKKW